MRLKDLREELEKDQEYLEEKKVLKPVLDLANKILELRLERGWSQSELAKRVGTRQSNISRIESGLANPTLKFLQRLAKALDADISVQLEKENELAEDDVSTASANKKQFVVIHVAHVRIPRERGFYGDFWIGSPAIPSTKERVLPQ
jgi:transcriptional regulator with XRE-family HTH domain